MADLDTLIKIVAGILIFYVIAMVGLAAIAFFGYPTNMHNVINSIPYLNTLVLIILAIFVGYYVFIK